MSVQPIESCKVKCTRKPELHVPTYDTSFGKLSEKAAITSLLFVYMVGVGCYVLATALAWAWSRTSEYKGSTVTTSDRLWGPEGMGAFVPSNVFVWTWMYKLLYESTSYQPGGRTVTPFMSSLSKLFEHMNAGELSMNELMTLGMFNPRRNDSKPTYVSSTCYIDQWGGVSIMSFGACTMPSSALLVALNDVASRCAWARSVCEIARQSDCFGDLEWCTHEYTGNLTNDINGDTMVGLSMMEAFKGSDVSRLDYTSTAEYGVYGSYHVQQPCGSEVYAWETWQGKEVNTVLPTLVSNGLHRFGKTCYNTTGKLSFVDLFKTNYTRTFGPLIPIDCSIEGHVFATGLGVTIAGGKCADYCTAKKSSAIHIGEDEVPGGYIGYLDIHLQNAVVFGTRWTSVGYGLSKYGMRALLPAAFFSYQSGTPGFTVPDLGFHQDTIYTTVSMGVSGQLISAAQNLLFSALWLLVILLSRRLDYLWNCYYSVMYGVAGLGTFVTCALDLPRQRTLRAFGMSPLVSEQIYVVTGLIVGAQLAMMFITRQWLMRACDVRSNQWATVYGAIVGPIIGVSSFFLSKGYEVSGHLTDSAWGSRSCLFTYCSEAGAGWSSWVIGIVMMELSAVLYAGIDLAVNGSRPRKPINIDSICFIKNVEGDVRPRRNVWQLDMMIAEIDGSLCWTSAGWTHLGYVHLPSGLVRRSEMYVAIFDHLFPQYMKRSTRSSYTLWPVCGFHVGGGRTKCLSQKVLACDWRKCPVAVGAHVSTAKGYPG